MYSMLASEVNLLLYSFYEWQHKHSYAECILVTSMPIYLSHAGVDSKLMTVGSSSS